MSSLAPNTYKQYDSCVKNWLKYCEYNNIHYLKPSTANIINFLSALFDNGAQYGTINTHKSAISLVLGSSYFHDECIKRFMKGVYHLKPSAPKYNLTWDPNIVLTHLAHLWPNETLDLENLSKKLSTLLALVTAHRVQTLSLIKICNINIIEGTEVIIKIPDRIKTSRLNTEQPILRLPFFHENPRICPARCLISYLEKTKDLRTSDSLLISFRKPFSQLSSQRLSQWIKDTLKCSGLDTSVFSAHSTRHAATSKAKVLGVNLDVIRKTAGWSQSSSVFAKFYNREIITNNNIFSQAILSNETM